MCVGLFILDSININIYSDIAKILGTTKKIVAKDSKVFAQEIGKYIDSKDQKRGKKDKSKSKAKENDFGDFFSKERQECSKQGKGEQG